MASFAERVEVVAYLRTSSATNTGPGKTAISASAQL
jgi:hypothetical protein